MVADAPPRTPLWQMTDAQLQFYADDELAPWDRRQTAKTILAGRVAPVEQYSIKVEEDDGA